MIENRNLEKGTRMVARYHKQNFICEVVEVEEGRLRYRLEDGREFKSPSAAGTAITGGACNGWAFWKVAVETKTAEDSTENPATPEQTESAVDTQAEEKPAEVKKTGTYRMRNQKGAPKGLARWFCYDCAEPFNAPAGEKHAVCPNNHSNKK
jgi:hypothetical protein